MRALHHQACGGCRRVLGRQRVEKPAQIAKRFERTLRTTEQQGRAGRSLQHPCRHNRSRAIGQLANGNPLPSAEFAVQDGHLLAHQGVPSVVDLGNFRDAYGRMNGAL
ncbi:hypothetical protein, partial [Corallococcus sp. AB011P]|uniref:hypothetical protein n=1 Tax=Corallococcus sp. AB011P TaxID=2316735 RepID=UPI001F2DEAFC